jgi:hypothetical protein
VPGLLVAVPLKQADGDVSLHLQQVLDTVYERAGYDLSVDYRTDLDPPVDEVTQKWIRSRVDRGI